MFFIPADSVLSLAVLLLKYSVFILPCAVIMSSYLSDSKSLEGKASHSLYYSLCPVNADIPFLAQASRFKS